MWSSSSLGNFLVSQNVPKSTESVNITRDFFCTLLKSGQVGGDELIKGGSPGECISNLISLLEQKKSAGSFSGGEDGY